MNQICLTRVTLNSLLRLTNLWPSDSGSNWNLEMLVFEERERPEYLQKNPRSKDENQEQTQPTFDAESGIKPGPHWWEASTLTIASPLLLHSRCVKR